MGHVEKRGKASWRIVTWTNTSVGPQRVQMTIRMDPDLPESVQKRDAERELRNLEKRLAQETAEAYTVRTWAAEWLDKILRPDASPVTIAGYRYLLDSRILPILGDYTLEELTPAILTDWLIQIRNDKRKTTRKPPAELSRDRRKKEERKLLTAKQLEKPLSVKTALNYYACLSAMLAAAVRLGHLEHNPMDRVKRPKQHKRPKRILTEEEAIQLLALLRDVPFEQRCMPLAILLDLLCALRLGEVDALRYCDVDFRRGTIRVERALKYTPETGHFVDDPKSESSVREIALPKSMINLLREGLAADQEYIMDMCIEDEDAGRPYRYHDNGLIVHNKYGDRVNKDTPSKWFRKFADAHGYKDVRFHDLRHVHASVLVAHKIDIAAIASRMGHSDAGVTLSTYTHPYAAQDRQAAKVMDNLLRRSAPDLDAAPDA